MKPSLDRLFSRVLRRGQILARPHERLLYSYDASNHRASPGVVLLPDTRGEVVACLKVCHQHGLPFIARGAGTNLAGASVAPKGEVLLSLTRLNRVLAVDAANRLAEAECGVVNLDLQKAAARHGLFFAPDPASQKSSTLGGNIAQNSGGPHCLKYGITTHHVRALEYARPDGSLVTLGNPYGEEGGADLRGLLVGGEGTLGVVLRAWLRLLPLPAASRTALLSFPGIQDAVKAVSAIIAKGIVPTALELMDPFILNAIEGFRPSGYPRQAGALMIAEVDGEAGELDAMMEEITAVAAAQGCQEVRLASDDAARHQLWEGRRAAHAAVASLKPSVWVEDGTVPRTRLAEALARMQEIGQRDGLQVGYLFHAGDGNFHPLLLFDDRLEAERDKVRRAGGEMLKVCVDLGGSITGEHGVGIDKLPYMEYQFDAAALQVMGEVKRLMDPSDACNPGKLIPPAYVKDAVVRTARPGSFQPGGRGGLWEPASEAEASEMLARAGREPLRLVPRGGGSKSGPPAAGAVVLSTRKLSGILDYDPANLTLEAQAGTGLGAVEDLLEKDGLGLAFAGSFPAQATLGGSFSCRESGPWGQPLRDHVLGMRALLPDGRSLTVGRKVVKNVAGLDLCRLWAGARGSLGLVTRLILKLHPLPQASRLLVFACSDLATARRGLEALRREGVEAMAYSLLSASLSKRMATSLKLPLGAGPLALLVDLAGRASSETGRIERTRRALEQQDVCRERYILEGANRNLSWQWVRQWGGEPRLLAQAWPGGDGLEAAWARAAGEEACFHFATGELKAAGGEAPGCAASPLFSAIKDHFDPAGIFPGLS